ncbi:MAG: hypothetical protein ACRDVZ_03625, partial [Jiangellaceae bacterium]
LWHSLREELEGLPFEMSCGEEEADSGVTIIWVEDPHGAGIGFDVILAGDEIIVVAGRGARVTFSTDEPMRSIVSFLASLMTGPVHESWSKRTVVMEVGFPQDKARYVTRRGGLPELAPRFESHSYTSYRSTHSSSDAWKSDV